MIHFPKTKNQSGFTIIEVLIATLVFSVVLIICLQGVTQIGKLYYKGVSSAQTQELIRNLSADFTQQIQFGGKEPIAVVSGQGGTPVIFCVGDYSYRAVLNRPLGQNGVDSILKRQTYSGNCTDLTDSSFNNAIELASKNMRIQKINITNLNGGLWSIDIKVALGENDLLVIPVPEGQTPPPGYVDDPAYYGDVHCQSGINGSEFCATAELSTNVIRRIR